MNEIHVKIKEEDITLVEKFLNYEIVTLSHDDPILLQMVEEAKSRFNGELKNPEISIKIKMEW